jgi:MoaA/NifB/PqqE/SkfB family radical SAM enzyme
MLGLSSVQQIRSTALQSATELVMRIPDSILLTVAETLLNQGIAQPEGRRFILKMLKELKSQWYRFHPNVRRRFTNNVFGNLMLFSGEKHRKVAERLGDFPVVAVISPTMRCNLKCEGCYSANYDREDAISTERFDRLLTECEELGIYFIVISGGEPFLRRDLLDMFEKHPDLEFMVYTNGTIIHNMKLAKKLAELGNVIPCISVEGFKDETDKRRGDGVYEKIDKVMDDLREEGVMFGFSATPMRHNNELLVSDEFVDYYIKKGCFIGWYFNYMPVGRDPNLDLMPTPEQRLYRLRRIREIRETKPILASDFWCDGELVGGCLSGARAYFHINASGGVEPCVFHQFSVDNILDKPLIECLDSAYFRHIRKELKSIENPLRPCPIIDHPEILRRAVKTYGSKPSQPGGEKLLDGELAKGLDEYARKLKEIMDPEFAKRAHGYVRSIWEKKSQAN